MDVVGQQITAALAVDSSGVSCTSGCRNDHDWAQATTDRNDHDWAQATIDIQFIVILVFLFSHLQARPGVAIERQKAFELAVELGNREQVCGVRIKYVLEDTGSGCLNGHRPPADGDCCRAAALHIASEVWIVGQWADLLGRCISMSFCSCNCLKPGRGKFG